MISISSRLESNKKEAEDTGLLQHSSQTIVWPEPEVHRPCARPGSGSGTLLAPLSQDYTGLLLARPESERSSCFTHAQNRPPACWSFACTPRVRAVASTLQSLGLNTQHYPCPVHSFESVFKAMDVDSAGHRCVFKAHVAAARHGRDGASEGRAVSVRNRAESRPGWMRGTGVYRVGYR